MITLNLINIDKSDIKYEIIRFPDGEVHFKILDELNHKEKLLVKCRITCADDLFVLMQVNDILERHGMTWVLNIYYLMSMRMDRVMSFNEAFNLKVVSNIISNFSCCAIGVYHPHSEVVYDILETHEMPSSHFDHLNLYKYQLCFPDNGANKRYSLKYANSYPILHGKKVRDKDTGMITSIVIENPEDYKGIPIMVVDDLCDAGGTFLGIAKAIKEIDANAKLNITIIHMVNRKGIENLSVAYDRVDFTNSYKDWDNLPDNCIMYDVINS